MPEDRAPSKRPIGQRRLAAIMFTDAVGFSSRVAGNEALALRLMKRDFEAIKKSCAQNDGEVLKSTGDGLLMSFPTAGAAVACALQVQKSLAAAAQQLPPEQIIEHRIGIHLGDIFVGDGDVMGNDVNIAARILNEAGAGEICVSQTVYDVVKQRLSIKGVFLGQREMKNLAEPVPIFRLPINPQDSVSPVIEYGHRAAATRFDPRWIVAFGATVLIVIAITSMALLRHSYTGQHATIVAINSSPAPAQSLPSPVNTLTDAETKAGWKLLFDGKSTAGWIGNRHAPLSPLWHARDGVFIFNGGGRADAFCADAFDDFELTLDWKIPPLGDSGVFYRCDYTPDWGHFGIQCQLIDNARSDTKKPTRRCGAACLIFAPIVNVSPAPDQWHHLRIVAQGAHCEHWIDDVKLAEYEQGSPEFVKAVADVHAPAKYGTFSSGWIVLEGFDSGGEFKNIKLRQLLVHSVQNR